MVGETYLELLRNWPHWAFEMTVEGATALIFTPIIRRLIRRHDRRHHG